MLSTLDTVIAFAVIMTVLSLLITIIVQMVSGAFSLRGKNLANALALTFQTIDPKIKEQAHSLAAQILRDPIFSDSILKKKDRVMKAINEATRVFMAAERKLADATMALKDAEQSLERERSKPTTDTTQTDIVEKESAIAGATTAQKTAMEELEKAKANPDVSVPPVEPNRAGPWGFWTGGGTILGSAIRPGEIYRILHEFAGMTKTEAAVCDVPPELVDTSTAIVAALQKSDQPAEESKTKLTAIADMVELFEKEARQTVANSLANLGVTMERATTQAYDRFQRWFGSGQDRAEQWFQMHIRIVTIAAAVATAFVLQLDTMEIFGRLRDNPRLVEALVKSAPGVLEKGTEVLNPTDTPAYHTYLLWLKKHPLFSIALPTPADAEHYHYALETRLTKPPDKAGPTARFNEAFDREMKKEKAKKDEGAKIDESLKKKQEAVATKTAYASWLESFPTYKLETEPDGEKIAKEDIVNAIKKKIDDDAAKPIDDLLADYDGLQTEGAMAFEKSRSAAFSDLQNKLAEAGFDLAPTPFWARWEKESVPGWANWGLLAWIPRYFFHVFKFRHCLGILMTAGLLSLGAPFWFNLLKNLMSLRPAVANLIEKRPSSAPALPATPSTPTPS